MTRRRASGLLIGALLALMLVFTLAPTPGLYAEDLLHRVFMPIAAERVDSGSGNASDNDGTYVSHYDPVFIVDISGRVHVDGALPSGPRPRGAVPGAGVRPDAIDLEECRRAATADNVRRGRFDAIGQCERQSWLRGVEADALRDQLEAGERRGPRICSRRPIPLDRPTTAGCDTWPGAPIASSSLGAHMHPSRAVRP